MSLSVNLENRHPEKKRPERLGAFGLDERALQDILFESLDRLFAEDELIMLMQPRAWREEPDLMAVDRDGRLYNLEIEAWESQSGNLLQVLRYGQLFGASEYDDLNRWCERLPGNSRTLAEAHGSRFGAELEARDFNREQVFVVTTNGLDYRTREAIRYWRRTGLDVRPRVYRVYRGATTRWCSGSRRSGWRTTPAATSPKATTSSTRTFRTGRRRRTTTTCWRTPRRPRTSSRGSSRSGACNGAIACSCTSREPASSPWASPTADFGRGAHRGNPDDGEGGTAEYSMRLVSFQRASPPLKAAEIKAVAGVDCVFTPTVFGVGKDRGEKLARHLREDGRLRVRRLGTGLAAVGRGTRAAYGGDGEAGDG